MVRRLTQATNEYYRPTEKQRRLQSIHGSTLLKHDQDTTHETSASPSANFLCVSVRARLASTNVAPPRRAAELNVADMAERRQSTGYGARAKDSNLENKGEGATHGSRFDQASAKYAGNGTGIDIPDYAGGNSGRLSSQRMNLNLTGLPASGKEQALALGTM